MGQAASVQERAGGKVSTAHGPDNVLHWSEEWSWRGGRDKWHYTIQLIILIHYVKF